MCVHTHPQHIPLNFCSTAASYTSNMGEIKISNTINTPEQNSQMLFPIISQIFY